MALTVVALPLALACDTAGALSDCEDVLAPREALPQCDGATCAQVQREPQRQVRWRLSLQHFEPINAEQSASLSADVLEHQLDCVLRQLQRSGLAPERLHVAGSPENDDIAV
ncbi:MAG TPA: hypothetical protein VMG12_20595, partial [Polyangiaceae bacterium]|nr:hypothetical protein [Polyangiaceae bacterium]